MAAGLLVSSHVEGFVGMVAAVVLMGFSYPVVISHFSTLVSRLCPQGSETLGTSFLMASLSIGTFLAPIALGVAGSAMASTAAGAPFALYAPLIGVLALSLLVFAGRLGEGLQ